MGVKHDLKVRYSLANWLGCRATKGKAAVNATVVQTLRAILETWNNAKRLECGDFSTAVLIQPQVSQ